ncbi:GNAT family N-acetyltransferase [Geminicoccus flavidas]|uniref:GNAT family N-acetyltransferase n=1 Tax=Geminicoccus flavidas TaxID=2506407 RepID=UPI00135713E9|nr:GNAT family N-acetyltransferase [Geminicoccus flavidas]
MEIREATERDDDLFVRHYLADWDTFGWPEERFQPDAADRVRQYIQDKRARGDLGGFVAMDGDKVAGALAFHLNYSPYPRIVRPAYLHLAYIWCMRVEEAYRGRGIGQRLIEHTADHLRSLGCTSMVLHSVPDARGFYERTGFAPATEFRRAL